MIFIINNDINITDKENMNLTNINTNTNINVNISLNEKILFPMTRKKSFTTKLTLPFSPNSNKNEYFKQIVDKMILFLNNKYNRMFKDKKITNEMLRKDIDKLIGNQNFKNFDYQTNIKKVEKSILSKASKIGKIKYQPVLKNNKDNIYNIKINKNVNRSIEKNRNYKTQMSFRIEKNKERKISSRNINDSSNNINNNQIENKENIESNFNITNYKYKVENNINKVNKTTDKRDIRSIIINFPNKKVKEDIKKEYIEKDNDKERIIYFDTSNIKNPQIPKEYINTIYYNLLKEENIGIEPCVKYNYMTQQSEVTERMRGILIDWLIEVHYKFGFTDETLYMTVSIIDRYLSSNQKTKSEIRKLTSKLDEMKTKNENNNSDIEQNIKNKKHELDSKLGINSMKKLQLEALEKVNENFNNEEYVLGLIKNWHPQAMFKYIQLYDKKPE